MQLTPIYDIAYADTSDDLSIEDITAAMANSVENSLDNTFSTTRALQTFRWANAAARAAQTGMVAGDLGYQVDTSIRWLYTGSAWTAVSPLSCALRKSTTQSLGTSAAAISWDVEITDPWNMHDNVTNNTRITVPVDGLYRVVCSVLNSNSAGTGQMYARINGTTDVAGSFTRRDGSATATIPLLISPIMLLSATNYVEIMIAHSTAAGTIGGGTSNGASVVSLELVGR